MMAKNPLVMAQVSPITFVSAKAMHQAGMPVIGPGVDGQEWGQQPYTNMFSTSQVAATMPTYAVSPQGWNGAKSLAVFGYAISPSSTAAAKNFARAADQAGLSVNYLNTSLPFGTVNVTAIVLAMKAKNIDGMYLPLDISTNLALITGARQAGITMKAVVSATGYGQSLLDQPGAVQEAQGVTFGTAGVPVELKTTATLAFQKALAAYAHFTGIPGYNYYTGWEVADLTVKAIEAGGANPTHQSIITNLRKVTNYTADGLLPTPVNFPDFGQPANPECGYSTILQGTNFVVTNNGKPTCLSVLH
jgi:ABC-type branched-subunit amino acid transport system substrate-binding protein